jgi:hypothetical protein
MPSELVRSEKRKIRNEKTGTYQLESDIEQEEDSYEIVDKFRFFIDRDSLRNAIKQKTSLKMRQNSLMETALEGDESNNEVTMDQSLLDKLASGEAVIDDTGENTIIRLTLDQDDFSAMIDKGNEGSSDDDDDDYDDEDIYTSGSTYISREEKIKSKDSMIYSTARMNEAESTLIGNEENNYGAKARQDEDTDRMIRRLQKNYKQSKLKKESDERDESDETDAWDGEDTLSDDDDDDYGSDESYDDGNKADASVKVGRGSKGSDSWEGEDHDSSNDYDVNNDEDNRKIKKKKAKPRQYLADMSMGQMSDDLYSTFVIGSVMAVLFNLNEFISRRILNKMQLLFKIIINSVPILKVRKIQIMRSPKPLLILSVLLFNLISFGLKIWIDSNRYAGIGYKEGQKQKRW